MLNTLSVPEEEAYTIHGNSVSHVLLRQGGFSFKSLSVTPLHVPTLQRKEWTGCRKTLSHKGVEVSFAQERTAGP